MDKQKKQWIAVVVVLAVLIGWQWSRYAATQRLMADLDKVGKSPAAAKAAATKLLAQGSLEDSLPAQSVPRRANAARALGLVGTKEAFTQLAILIKDPENKPQDAASKAFGDAGAPGIPQLLPVFKDGDDRAKKAAIAAFSLIGEPAIEPLTAALADAALREQAVKALAQISIDRQEQAQDVADPARRAALLAVADKAVQPLLAAAKNPDKALQTIAIEALGNCHEKRAVPDALAALGEKDQRVVAIKALGLIGDSRGTIPLVPYLKDEKLRLDVVTSLGEIGDPRALPFILAELTDPESQFQSRGILALQQIGQPGAGALAAALKSPSVYVRRAAAQGLLAAATPGVNGALFAALKSDPDYEVRAAAAQAAGSAGNSAAVGPLIAALRDPQWQVVEGATKGLAGIGPAAVGPLTAVWGTGDSEVAYQASLALTGMGDKVVAPLLASLASGNGAVRRWAAVTLGAIGSQAAIEPLERMASSGNADDTRVAKEALRKLRVPTVTES